MFFPATLAVVLLGCILLGAVRVLSWNTRMAEHDALLRMTRIGGWTLIILGMFLMLFIVVAVFLLFLVLMAIMRNRRAQQSMLLAIIAESVEQRIPLIPVLEGVAAENWGVLRGQIKGLVRRLNNGLPLPDAVDASFGLLPREGRLAIRVGYEMGDLPSALRELLDVNEVNDPIWAQSAGRLVYLFLLVGFAALIGTFHMLKIVPAFQEIFGEFGAELPGPTRVLIDLSDLFASFFYLIGPLSQPLLLVAALCVGYHVGLFSWSSPGMTWLFWRTHTAAVLDSLALVVRKGRPMEDALKILARLYPARALRKRLRRTARDVERGADWYESMRRHRLLRRADSAVLASATRVGNLPWALKEMAAGARRRDAYRFEGRAQGIFVFAFLIVGGMVGFYVVALFLPLVVLITDLI